MILTSSKRRRVVLRWSVTRLENYVDVYEIKDELTHTDHFVIQRLIKEFEMLNNEFHQYQYIVVELQKNEAGIEKEQAALMITMKKSRILSTGSTTNFRVKGRFSVSHHWSLQTIPSTAVKDWEKKQDSEWDDGNSESRPKDWSVFAQAAGGRNYSPESWAN